MISFPDPKFKSMTRLSWFMNDATMPAAFMRAFRRTVVYDSDSDGVDPLDRENEATRSIRFILNPSHFVNGLIKLRCTASSIPPLYTRSSEVIARLEPVRGASSPGRYSSGQSCHPYPHTCLLLCKQRSISHPCSTLFPFTASTRVRICSHLSLVLVVVLALVSRT